MNMKRRLTALLALIMILSASFIPAVYADNPAEHVLTDMYDGSTVKTGKDNGYSGSDAITNKDVHFGWSLGQFTLKGFTEVYNENGIPVFLVNPGDSITLSYKLLQNIDRLNGEEKLTISNDKNGYDLAFQVEKTDFGRGALLVKFTDHNNRSRVTPHLDYLTAVKNKASKATISNMEEGDYEVALDYEIAEKKFPGYKYHNYRTTFKFKIRNSNCMIYLRDLNSKNEFANYSVAEKGFFLEYTSFYQRIIVKREILADNGNGYTLTPRTCKAAYDGAQYTDPGVYTVTVKNVYTGESVDMVIAVGDDPLTNAYVTANCVYKPEQLAEMIDSGTVTITDDWRVEVKETPKPTEPTSTPPIKPPSGGSTELLGGLEGHNFGVVITVAVVALVAVIGIIIAISKKKRPPIDPALDDYKVSAAEKNNESSEEVESTDEEDDAEDNHE